MLASSRPQLESRLLALAAAFLSLYAIALTLAPAVRARSWQVAYPWQHWLALLAWLVVFLLARRQAARLAPARDSFLLPVVALMSGWGLMTIWRLFPYFGLRQTAWLLVAGAILIAGQRFTRLLDMLRSYKYLWLTVGLVITALTLFFGTNPLGYGPTMWLGCCGIYFQPSEPLKLLLIIYLAAYLADQAPALMLRSAPRRGKTEAEAAGKQPSSSLFALLVPSLIMTGFALAVLLAQRDLGTAAIFLFLYAVMVYLATGRPRVILFSAVFLVVFAVLGYLIFDLVRIRVDAWLNPWLDPSNRSYQIVQGLFAFANGGAFGRGPGVGDPNFVPIPHSDYILASLAEEFGLVGVLGLLALLGLLAARGMRTAIHARQPYHRYMAGGLTSLLVGQSLLIIAGNLRLLPLTGVTFPFLSYGGSSLVVAFIALLLLLHIQRASQAQPPLRANAAPYLNVFSFLLLGLSAAALAAGWWQIVRGPDLLTRTDNPRRALADLSVPRGSLLDRSDRPINRTGGEAGNYQRQAYYPDLSNIVGYTHPAYGQSALEAALDPLLRGLQGNPALTIWWQHILYGMPPPGRDARLSLDLELQQLADAALQGYTGALALINAENGEILAMASHPTFDANRLAEDWEQLNQDAAAPLLNRAVQGQYPPGAALNPTLAALALETGELPVGFRAGQVQDSCPIALSTPLEWDVAIASGCQVALDALLEAVPQDKLDRLNALLQRELEFPLESPPVQPDGDTESNLAAGISDSRLSPLQMVGLAAALSTEGSTPAAQILLGINDATSGWQLPGVESTSFELLSAAAARQVAERLALPDQPLWQSVASLPGEAGAPGMTWYLGGTQPGWQGTPLALALVLEEENPDLAAEIGARLLQQAANR